MKEKEGIQTAAAPENNKKEIVAAYVINYMNRSGPGRVVEELISALDRREVRPVLVTLLSDRNDERILRHIRSTGIDVIECGYRSFGAVLRNMKSLQETLLGTGADLIHSHGLLADWLTASMRGGKFIASMQKRTGKPAPLLVSTLHSNLMEDYRDAYGPAGALLLAPFHIRILNRMDLCVCCSASVHRAMSSSLHRSSFVRNGLDTKAPPESRVGKTLDKQPEDGGGNGKGRGVLSFLPQGARVFLFAGRLIRRKNVDWMIRSFVSCRQEDEYLIICGTGDREKACRKAADDHVIFAGFVRDPGEYYESADVYISASRSEGLSISIIEALQRGTGLFLSDIPSHTEVFGIRPELYLGEIYETDSFADGMRRLRANRSRLDRDQIREFQRNHLSAQSMADAYLSLYRKLTGTSPARDQP